MLRFCRSTVLSRGLGLRSQSSVSSSASVTSQRRPVGLGSQPRGAAGVDGRPGMGNARHNFVDLSSDPVKAITEDVLYRLESASTPNQVLATFLKAKLRPETGGKISVAALSRLRLFDRTQQMPPLVSHPAFESLCSIFTVNAKYLAVGEMTEIAVLLMDLGAFAEEKLKTALVNEAERRLGEMSPETLGMFLHLTRNVKVEPERKEQLKKSALDHVLKKLDGELNFGGNHAFPVEVLSMYGASLPEAQLESLLKQTEQNMELIIGNSFVSLAEALHALGEKGADTLKLLATNARNKLHVMSGPQLRQLLVFTQEVDPELKESASSLAHMTSSPRGDFIGGDPERRKAFDALQGVTKGTMPHAEALQQALDYFLPRLQSEVPVVFLGLTYAMCSPELENVKGVEEVLRAFLSHPQNPDGWATRQLAVIFLRLMRLTANHPELCAEVAMWASKTLPSRLGDLEEPRFSMFVLRSFIQNGYYSKDFFESAMDVATKNAESFVMPQLITFLNVLRFVPYFNESFAKTVCGMFQSQPELIKSLTVPQIVRLSVSLSQFNYGPKELFQQLADEVESRETVPLNVGFFLSNFVDMGIYPKKLLKVYFEDTANRPSEQLWAHRLYKMHLAVKANPELGISGLSDPMVQNTEKRLAISGRRRANAPDQEYVRGGAIASRAFGSESVNRHCFSKNAQNFCGVLVFDRKNNKIVPCAAAGLIVPGETTFPDTEQEDLVFIGLIPRAAFKYMKNDPTHMTGVGHGRLVSLKQQGWSPVVISPVDMSPSSSKEELRAQLSNVISAQTGINIAA